MNDSPALVLNADFRPLSYFPLSLWSWQDTVKAVFLERVNIISEYEREVRSPGFSMRLPSVIALKRYIPMSRRPAFTRFNVFLRDRFRMPVLRRRAGDPGTHVRPRGAAVARRADQLGQCRQRLHRVQPAEGQPAAQGVRSSPEAGAGGAVQRAAAAARARVSAQLPARTAGRDFLYWDSELEAE